MSSAELGKRTGMSGQQIRRLELGERQLKMEDAIRIGDELRVGAQMLMNPSELEIESDEVELVASTDPAASALLSVASALGLRLSVYRVTPQGHSVARVGIKPGDVIGVNETPERISGLRGLDVVLVQIAGEEDGTTPGPILLRQFVPPDMLISNRDGYNTLFPLGDEDLKPKIIGVVERSKP